LVTFGFYVKKKKSSNHPDLFIQASDMDGENRDKLEKRGFTYQCLGCDEYWGERGYVEAHYYKYHTISDNVPYYCSLCHFMGERERERTGSTREGIQAPQQAEGTREGA
jgi:hypothetical protein